METQSRISVRLILQHTNEYNKEVNELIEKCSSLRATIMDITKIERDYQAITEEIKGKEERLEVLKQKFFNPKTVVAIESFAKEVNDLRISETRRRYTEQYRSWKDTISDFNIPCKSLYELEISVTCLSVNSSVDPTMIRSRCLSFEEQERTRAWTKKLSLMLKRCIQLSKEEMITLEKIGDHEED
ncbi:hypothetical protein HanIR_Chr03g0133801 [Helianthus annuus]|nr:hypothetical protein HanIR_Chr03g0133801 [Helianthus annuus]